MAQTNFLPYPQVFEPKDGSLPLGPADYITEDAPSQTEQVAMDSLSRFLPRQGKSIPIRLGSVEEGFNPQWLSAEQQAFLKKQQTSPEAYLLDITPEGITVVGKSRWGMLYGSQTVNQIVLEAMRADSGEIQCISIRDWPDMRWRCLAPQLTWYSGYNRLEGFDCGNWNRGEWKWLVDWSLLRKFNSWAVCMVGYWPFSLPGYEETTLQVESFYRDPVSGQKTPYRFVHPNIRHEFFPEVIRYANSRGIKVHAYIAINSFDGGYTLHHPQAVAGGADEMLPFAPGVHEYWNAFLGRILEMGFDGFVFENPEAYHVPNQNDECYETFWKPWADTYGFSSRQETDQNNPPLGVHVEYCTWLCRTFNGFIQQHAKRLGRRPEFYFISHVLMKRIVDESSSMNEARKWFDLIDEKSGLKIPYIINEEREKDYVKLLGGERIGSLGGRGAACICARRRIASVNGNWQPASFGTGLDFERNCHRRIHEAGGFGAMAYTFEWRLCEAYGYTGAQYLWRASGVPDINNDDQTGFLDYACRVHYGDEVGPLAARALDAGSHVNEAMIIEGIHGPQYPDTGRPLYRDYQFLAARADEAVEAAREAFRRYTGNEPDLDKPLYKSEEFRWDGYDHQADFLFKAETLRRLCVSSRRSQKMCELALAYRLAMRLASEIAPIKQVLEQIEKALAAAEENQRLYQLNYDDDYDSTDGMCVRLTNRIRPKREELLSLAAPNLGEPTPSALRLWSEGPILHTLWEKQSDIIPEAQEAHRPGVYLSVDLGLNVHRTNYCLGVVFTVQTQQNDGKWATIFRRSLDKNSRNWQHWDIPIAAGGGSATRLRFLTDSYSVADNRRWPSWRWALWGGPQLIRITADGKRRVVYDFLGHIADAHPFVRLDSDGKDRPFDGVGEDSTGATFKAGEPGAIEVLQYNNGRDWQTVWQWVDGFENIVPGTTVHERRASSCLGKVSSWWAGEGGEVTWTTAPPPESRETAFVFLGGTGSAKGEAEFWCNGRRVLTFQTGGDKDAHWEENGAALHYVRCRRSEDEKSPCAKSSVFVLRLPGNQVTAGKGLLLSVKIVSGKKACFTLHGIGRATEATVFAPLPPSAELFIIAFTPHRNGAFGITGAEFTIPKNAI